MKRQLEPQVRLPRLRPLVASFALAAIATVPVAGHARSHDQSADIVAWPISPTYLRAIVPPALTIIKVLNCDDSGSGSLRAAYASAIDNSRIDMRDLKCSKITLTSGALTDPANKAGNYGVAILGAGQIIDGSGLDRVLVNHGSSLILQNLTITNGKYVGNVGGGCIYSTGSVILNSEVIVSSCQLTALANGQNARGGAIYSQNKVSMFDTSSITQSAATSVNGNASGGAIWARAVAIDFSTISGNTASGNNGSIGGGIFASGYGDGRVAARVEHSTISNNRAGTYLSFGGGLYAAGSVDVAYSTISGNQANYGGGVFVNSVTSDATNSFEQVTISGNSAVSGGGMSLQYAAILNNCTITNNRASVNAGGLHLSESTLTLNSTIVAANLSQLSPESADVDGVASSLFGANNLIIASRAQTPPDTITQDPLFAPLRNNAGATQTHALLAGSPAIDTGNNISSFSTDQRGGPHPRVLGRAADIGAYEYDPDKIFADGFD